MAALGAEGRRFGLVVCDPPAFAPNKGALEAGLRAYERVARLGAALVEPDGFLVLCSCSHAADLARFREASLRGVARAGRAAQILHVGGAGAGPPGASGAGRDRLSQGAVPAGSAREGGARRLRALPAGDARDAARAAAAGGFAPLWSARILEEWARATRRLPEGAEAAARARDRAAARATGPTAEVAVPDASWSASLSLPDPDDRHVLAAAIAGGAGVLVTLNRADFPTRTLARHGVLLREPDGLLVELARRGHRPRRRSREAGARRARGRPSGAAEARRPAALGKALAAREQGVRPKIVTTGIPTPQYAEAKPSRGVAGEIRPSRPRS